MADVIPPMNLAPEATPWGRWAQSMIVELHRNLARATDGNAEAIAKSSNRVITSNVQSLTALTTGLQAQINALTSTAITTSAVTATGPISAGNFAVSGPSVLTGNVSTGGDLTVGGLIRNVAAYANPITTSFRNLFVTSVDGQFGYNLSSRRHKQDITDALVDPAKVLLLRLVTYRYIRAVEEHGDDAATEHGLIAEEVEAAGLGWLVDYDEDGRPLTLRFHLLAMALLPLLHDFEERLTKLEAAAA